MTFIMETDYYHIDCDSNENDNRNAVRFLAKILYARFLLSFFLALVYQIDKKIRHNDRILSLKLREKS